jgi:hypothetical protein
MSDGVNRDPQREITPAEAALLIKVEGRVNELERQQAEEKKEAAKQQKSQVFYNKLLMVFTGLLFVTSAVSNVFLLIQARASLTGSEAATRAAKAAEDALDSSNDSFQQTLIQMKAQIRAMQRSADAAKSAAFTADATLKNAQTSFKQEQRGYLAVTYYLMSNPPTITDKDGVHVCGDVHVANSGRTPALNVAIFRRATFGENAQATVEGTDIPKSLDSGDVLGTTGDKWGTGCTPKGVDPTTRAETD